MFAIARPSTPAVAKNGARNAAYSAVAPAPPPFAFLGKIVEDGGTVVLLYRAGRTLKVPGAGRVADDYEVDALMENLVVLRHLPSGTQQVIELAAREADPLSSQPEDFPRD